MTPAEQALEHLAYLGYDVESDELLAALVSAFMAPLVRASLVALGDETLRPWQAITDPAAAPLWAMPHAAQYTGGLMPERLEGESDTDYLARARHEVVFPRGMRRGGWAAALAAARRHLTGTRTVLFRERFGGDEWALGVVTRVAETPDPDAVEAAVLEVLPAGVELHYTVRDTKDWEHVRTTYFAWAIVDSDNATWQEVLEL